MTRREEAVKCREEAVRRKEENFRRWEEVREDKARWKEHFEKAEEHRLKSKGKGKGDTNSSKNKP